MQQKQSATGTKTPAVQDTPEHHRRKFLKKFGKYAVSTPVVTFTLMSTYSSKAIASVPPL